MKYTCHICWREFDEKDMKKNVMGISTEMCNTCYSIIGKGPGYAESISDEEAEKWFEGTTERREK